MNEKRLKKYEYLSEKIRTQFFIILVTQLSQIKPNCFLV